MLGIYHLNKTKNNFILIANIPLDGALEAFLLKSERGSGPLPFLLKFYMVLEILANGIRNKSKRRF